ncbi:MAG TPA: metallophosphoesterase [Dictyoglomaceae bacterium]|nr:metallophosphoesterase [Dictyoglomaceae bacterium]HOL39063.1 metallophosphoesterase [Dictyoglomaceae bacterium]HOP94402.1 metallophosphoesterase [Dictyoglomaceae bacterium]
MALSDLHLDFIRLRNGFEKDEESIFIKNIFEEIEKENVNVFVIAGDISAKLWEIELFFEFFAALSGVKIFVPGNHDIWKEKDISSDQKYKKMIPDLCGKYNIHFLPENPLLIGDIAFVGTLGWYDYSFGSEAYSIEEYEKGIYDGLRWRETFWKLVDFYDSYGRKLNNVEICEIMQDELKNSLEKVEKEKKIVAVTHTVPFKELLHMKNFFSAYLGSEKLGEILIEDGRVRYVICGHEHNTVIFKKENLEIYKPTFGYLDKLEKWKERLERAIKIIDI